MSVEIIRNALCIVVRNLGEYGAFFIREGKRGEGPNTQFYCELTIQSSFGNVGYFWSHMGSPACTFFTQTSRDYVVDKLWGEHSRVFDAEKTEEQMRRMILEERRRGSHTKSEARDIYNAVQDLSTFETLERFCDAYAEYSCLLEWCHIGDIPFVNVINPQAAAFWEKLWPEFLQALNEEALRPRDIVP